MMRAVPTSVAGIARTARRVVPGRLAFGLFLALLVWMPLPLGSNRPWSWSLMLMLVASCALLLAVEWRRDPLGLMAHVKPLWPALPPAILVLAWAGLQASPFLPSDWHHPLWRQAALLLDRPLTGAVSIDPWRTVTEAAKLCAYGMVLILACVFARNGERARVMLDTIIVTGAAYAAYAVALQAAGLTPAELLTGMRADRASYLSGPFVLHNSYATFAGFCTLAIVARAAGSLEQGSHNLEQWRRLVLRAVRRPSLVAALVLIFATLLASGSRAGFAATVAGAAVMAVLSLARDGRRAPVLLGLLLVMAVLMLADGHLMSGRFDSLAAAGAPDQTRLAMWGAGLRMIAAAPLTGMGLGSFQDLYPLYADRFLPYIVDKAHNDYLELAAGLGLPAAILWWLAMAAALAPSLRSAWTGGPGAQYGLLAIGATVLVAVQSVFDFSLQIPAVAILYATLVGMGAGRAQIHRSRTP